MDQPQGKPGNKRRRLIVVVCLAFLSFGTWWEWPRGDARFVGHWAISRTAQGRPIQVWQMSRNGGGWAQSVSSGRFTSLNWSVEGNTLRLGYYWHTADGAFFKFQQFLQAHTGWHPWVVPGEEWEIREVTKDSVLLWPGGATESYTLTRVPE